MCVSDNANEKKRGDFDTEVASLDYIRIGCSLLQFSIRS